MSDRRTWIRQAGLVVAGLGLTQLEAFAISSAPRIVIQLRSNENPYGPSAATRAAMSDAVGYSNRYAWAQNGKLLKAFGKLHGLTDDYVLLGAGSTEIIDTVVRLAARQPGNFVLASPTYNYWTDAAVAQGLVKREVPVKSNKQHDLEAMLKAIDDNTRLVYICNPDNPSGTVCRSSKLRSFITEAAKRTLILVDEAYLDYSSEPSLVSMVPELRNVVVAKTCSKIYGMAGVRVGYGIAHSETISKLSALQASPNASVNAMAAAGALAAIKDVDFVSASRTKNEEVKRYTIQQLEVRGLPCIPSNTNFIYFSLANYKDDYFLRLKEHKIEGTRIYEDNGKWTRITIGTMDEMLAFLKAIG